MANQIFATLDKSEKWLDKQREIDNFCLVKGFEITDLSEETVDAGIRAYLCA